VKIWYPAPQLHDPIEALKQYRNGIMYYLGEDVPQDYEEAAKWFRLAADQGDADAQCYLGDMYAKGCGVPQDGEVAARWYRLAADQRHAEARKI
jgi:TPR repeat protein